MKDLRKGDRVLAKVGRGWVPATIVRAVAGAKATDNRWELVLDEDKDVVVRLDEDHIRARQGARSQKLPLSIKIDADVLSQARDVVASQAGSEGLTLAGLVQAALEKEISSRRAARGRAFPRRRERLRPGRPAGS